MEFFYILNYLGINYSEDTVRGFCLDAKSNLVSLSSKCFLLIARIFLVELMKSC